MGVRPEGPPPPPDLLSNLEKDEKPGKERREGGKEGVRGGGYSCLPVDLLRL